MRTKKVFFVVVFASESSLTYRELKLSSWVHVESKIDFKFRPSEPLPRPDFETATTTDLADIALYVNNKVFFGAYFCCRIITDIQGA